MRVVISAGHGLKVRGASGYLDEVDEARRVVTEVAAQLTTQGVIATTYWDDVSTSQSENLERIVDFHNAQTRDLDISIHFNAYQTTSKPMGTEVLYVSSTGMEIADEVVDAMCEATGLPNRGPKKRTDLYFLNNTEEPAILVEVCFVDSSFDASNYEMTFTKMCAAMATAISGEDIVLPPDPGPPVEEVLFRAVGRCSHFGGPNDTGVSPSEGLAFIFDVDEAPQLFLPYQPPGTTGLARRLNPWVHYVACRWDYDVTSKTMLRDSGQRALVRSNGWELLAFPADWGPHGDTSRVADLSPGLMEALGITTDDEVEVLYPWEP